MKRFLLTLAVLMASITAAFATVYSGKCGTNVTYTLDTETGVLKIEGTGLMSSYYYYYYDFAPWYSNRSYVKEVHIAQGVTNIGSSAFYDCSSLTSITIPEGVTSIGHYAFNGCSSLTSINIPEGVTSIGECAFYGCSSLTSITIPEGVTSIGRSAFYNCYCVSTNVHNNTSFNLEDYGMTICSLEQADGLLMKDNVAVGYRPWANSINIPNGVTSIGERAFYNCSTLTSVTIPNSVTSIGEQAFKNCI